jgi:hypothetical protein|tara:strand:+ start:225 stop:443 length:219 start_codon:yes stop_codon:yes gene_type:complete
MFGNILNDKIMADLYREIADKWKERQRLEEELGIPTSTALTEKFIAEEYAKTRGELLLKDVNKFMGEFLNGR